MVVDGKNISSTCKDIEKYLVSEVCSFAEVDKEVANRLTIWALNIGEYKDVFEKYIVSSKGNQYLFLRDRKDLNFFKSK